MGWFDNLSNGLEMQTTNPLFLGGAALMSGEGMGGMLRGMQAGNQFQQQRKQQQEAEEQKARWQQYTQGGMGGLDPKMAELVRAAGPQGMQYASQYMLKQPELEMERQRLRVAQAAEARQAQMSAAQLQQLKMQTPEWRMANAAKFGIDPNTPEGKRFIVSGDYQSKPDVPASVREWQAFNKLSKEDQERYLTMKRSDRYLDTGTGFVRPSQVDPTAPPVSVVNKNNAEEARQKVVGRETGELEMGKPKAAAALEAADAKTAILTKTIGEARAMIGPMSAGMGGALLSRLPGTTARDLAAKIDTLKANAGFQELQSMRDNSPTGGALGQVAVQELAMLQATVTSLEQAQTPAQLIKALDAFEKFTIESKARRKRAFDATYSRVQPAPAGAANNKDPLGIR